MARTDRAADAKGRRTTRRFAAGALAWLGLLALLTTLGALGLGACGLAWPGGPTILTFCPDPAAARPDDDLLVVERERQSDLLGRLDEIRLALINAPDCPAPPIEVAELPPAETADPPELVEPAPPMLPAEQDRPVDDSPADAIAAEPTPTEPPPLEPPIAETEPEPELEQANPFAPPVPESRPEAPPQPERPEPPTEPQPAPEPPEDIPADDWDEADVSFLEGCWTLVTDYTITRTDTDEEYRTRDWQMCFDQDGRGSQTLNFDNGMSCSGDVDARFEPSGELVVTDQGMVPCDSGVGIDQRIMRCFRLPDGTAACSTQHTEPPPNPVSVRFQR